MNARKWALPGAVFLLYLFFFMLLFRDTVFFGKTLIRGDIGPFYYPIWKYTVTCVRSGILPFWNPYCSFGAPFFADTQTCVLYPLSLILYLGDFSWALNNFILFHLPLASFFTYLWMKDCGASTRSALVSGVAFGTSGYMMAATSAISLTGIAYFPLALLTYRRALANRGFFWKGIAAAVLACQYLSGDPAKSFITLFVLFLVTVHHWGATSLEAKKIRWRPVLVLVTVLGIFLALTSFQMLLFLEFVSHSDRFHSANQDLLMYSMPPSQFLGVIFPYLPGLYHELFNVWSRQTWLGNYYAGVTVLAMGVIGASSWKRRTVAYHLLLAALGVVLALGKYSPIYVFLHRYFPLLGFIRYPVRFFFLFSFAAACLAGFGLDKAHEQGWGGKADRRAYWRAGLLLAFIFLTSFYLLYFSSVKEFIADRLVRHYAYLKKPPYYTEAAFRSGVFELLARSKQVLLFAVWTFAALFTFSYSKSLRRPALALIPALMVADLILANNHEPRLDRRWLETPASNVRAMVKDHSLFRVSLSPKAAAAIDSGPKNEELDEMIANRERLAPGLSFYYGLYETSGYDSLFLKETRAIFHRSLCLNGPGGRFLDMLNVKYITSPNDSLGDRWVEVNQTPYANLFRNKNVLPRAFLAKEARFVPEGKRSAVLEELSSDAFDPEKEIFIEGGALQQGRPGQKGDSRIDIVDYTASAVKLRAVVSDRPWLFLSDAYYPGWKAWVDGRRVKIWRANYAFRAVWLDPGEHAVLFRYDPDLFKVGSAITLLTLLGLGAFLIGHFRKRKLGA